MLDTWVDGPTKSNIVAFVGRVTTAGTDHVAREDRVVVFDNDGTLWCERPMYIQLDFVIRSSPKGPQRKAHWRLGSRIGRPPQAI